MIYYATILDKIYNTYIYLVQIISVDSFIKTKLIKHIE